LRLASETPIEPAPLSACCINIHSLLFCGSRKTPVLTNTPA
jgi:hypothetical protein